MQFFVQDDEVIFKHINNSDQIENIGPLIKDASIYDIHNEINRIIDDISHIIKWSYNYDMLDVAYHLIQKSVLDSFQFVIGFCSFFNIFMHVDVYYSFQKISHVLK